MTPQSLPELSETLKLIASLEAKCEELRRAGDGPEVLGELETLLAEIRNEIAAIDRGD